MSLPTLQQLRIFVGCGSRNTSDPIYIHAAKRIGAFIAQNGHTLVFGGCNSGLMGEVYKPVSYTGNPKKVLISILSQYKTDLDSLMFDKAVVCRTLRERKEQLYSMADVLVFLPGGPGTYDELFSALESKRSHEHNKPILVVNINNHFEHFIGMLERAESDGFADNYEGALYHVVNSVKDAIAYMEELQK